MKRIFFLLCVIALCLSLSACATAPQQSRIVATTQPVYEFTTILCQGTDLTVDLLITENVSCLHDYTLQVSQMRALESAEMVVISGMGLEEFLQDVLTKSEMIADASIGITPLCHDEDAAEHHDHHHEEDPHIWLDPENARTMAANICSALCRKYPEYIQVFQQNLAALDKKLNLLTQYAQQELSELSCRQIITFHDGFGYMAEAYDLEILAAMEEESGAEASAAEMIHIAQLVEENRLNAIFTELNGSSNAASVISAETSCKIYALDMGMTGNSYFDAMYHNIDTLKEALG